MQYMLMCRSLTYAQRSARVLERAGITGTVARAPKTASTRGCAYCVIVTPRHKDKALAALAAAGLSPERVLRKKTDGTVEEAEEEI